MGEVKQAVWLHTHSSYGLCTMYTLPKYFPTCGATAQCRSRCYHRSQCLFLIFSLSCSLSMSSILFQPKAVTNQSDAAYILFNFIESRGSKHKAEMCRIQGHACTQYWLLICCPKSTWKTGVLPDHSGLQLQFSMWKDMLTAASSWYQIFHSPLVVRPSPCWQLLQLQGQVPLGATTLVYRAANPENML